MLRRSRGIRKGIIAAVALALVATVLTFSWWWPLAQGLWRLFHAQSDEIQLVEAVVALLLLIVSPIIRLISGGNATSDLGRALEEPVRVLSDEELMSRYPDRVKGIFVARGALKAAMLRQWERLLLVGRSGIGKTTRGRELILRARHVGEVDTVLEPTEGFPHLGSETSRLRLRQMV